MVMQPSEVKSAMRAAPCPGANLFLPGAAHDGAPTRGTMFFARKKLAFRNFVQVIRHQRITGHGPPPKKRTDSKKGPFFDPFGRKTGVGLPKKSILFCTFSPFSGFSAGKWLSVSLFQNMGPSQKIVPKNPR
jgi:hypothetical protein